jgi:hypothetical protein
MYRYLAKLPIVFILSCVMWVADASYGFGFCRSAITLMGDEKEKEYDGGVDWG